MIATSKIKPLSVELAINDISQTSYFLKVKTSDRVFHLKLSEIYYLQSSSNYTYIYWSGGRILSAKTLKYYEAQLGDQFIRSHRSYLVNKLHIKARIKRTHKLKLTGDNLIPISRVNRKFLLNQ